MSVLLCILLLGAVLSEDVSYRETVKYLDNLIATEIAEAFIYPLPENAYEYRPNSTKIREYGSYDYIIVGAGSTGAVLATRLSEDPNLKILLLEAGGRESPFSDIPGMMLYLQGLRFNWNFESVPQTTCCLGMVNNSCPYPRGKAIGGSSVISALMYVRGNRHDFDKWAAHGNRGWSYRDVLPYFKKSENSQIDGDPGYHGKGGLHNVEYHRPYSPRFHAFIEANIELGRKVLDYNGKEQLGVARTQLNVLNGRRHSTGRAFLSHAENRANLKILTHSLATKVLVEEGRLTKKAYGVQFSHGGKLYIARASKEVIVSAGAIGSPQLLMLSGIGPAEHLRQHGIRVIRNLEVGSNLQDHPTFFGFYVTTNHAQPTQTTTEYIEEFLEGAGPLTIPDNLQGLGFFQTNLTNTRGVPDIEIVIVPDVQGSDTFPQKAFHFTNQTFGTLFGRLDVPRSFSLLIMVLHPESRGTVRLRSSNPYDYPLIDPRFLSDPKDKDIKTMYQGIQLGLQMLNTEAFRKFNATVFDGTLPACMQHAYLSKDYWYCQIRHLTMHLYQACGTCAMGPNPAKGAVVNSHLKVHGIERLRVADASIFPLILSGHLNAASIMVGEKLADMLKGTSAEKCDP